MKVMKAWPFFGAEKYSVTEKERKKERKKDKKAGEKSSK